MQPIQPIVRSIVRSVIPAAALVAVAAAPTVAHAHFIWATVESGQARFALLENVGEATSAKFEKYVADLSPQYGGKVLALGAPRDGARYGALPAGPDAGKEAVVAESTVGVRERGGETYLLVYHAKGAATLAAAAAMTKAPAELSARRDGKELIISVWQEGRPAPQNEVWVQWPSDEAPSSVRTDRKGEARIPWPAESPERGGFVGIRAMVKEAKAGEVEGKRYLSVHRWATLTFLAAEPEADTAAK